MPLLAFIDMILQASTLWTQISGRYPECRGYQSCVTTQIRQPGRRWRTDSKPFLEKGRNRDVKAALKHRCRPKVAAIGFDLTGNTPSRSVEKRAADLTTDAASLLLLQSVLKGKPAVAFLKVLASLQRKSSDEVLAAYGGFFREMASIKNASWQDYILDELLAGRDNAWAKAVARGEANSKLEPAIEHDLDVLQKLALGDSTLAAWVKEAVPELLDSWLTAAWKVSPAVQEKMGDTSRNPDKLDLSQRATDKPAIWAEDCIQGPATAAERRQWREKIAGEWRWSTAVSHLRDYFHQHGFGLTAQHSILQWTNGALQALPTFDSEYCQAGALPVPTTQLHQYVDDEFLPAIRYHLERGYDERIYCKAGVPQEFAQILLLRSAQNFAAAGLRIVLADAVGTGSIERFLDLTRVLAQHRRIKFLLIDVADKPLPGCASSLWSDQGPAGLRPPNVLHVILRAQGETQPAPLRAGSLEMCSMLL